MENLILILLSTLIIFIIVLIIVLGFFGHRFLKIREKELMDKPKNIENGPLTHDSVEKPSKTFKMRKSISPDLLKAMKMKQEGGGHFCLDHPEEYSLGLCAISGEPYCEKCLSVQSDIKVAKKYLDIYLDNQWKEVLMLRNNTISYDMIDRLIKMKEELWKSENIPLIVQGHHKINIDNDEIEIYTVILSRSEDEKYIKGELSFIN